MPEANESSMPPLREVTAVSVDRLVLDRKNPRLMATDANASSMEIIAQLYRSEDLSELLRSIAANGYLDIEPLVVVAGGDSWLTVLEGNRRLAALRLFRDPGLARQVRDGCGVSVVVPQITDEHRASLDRVSVRRVARREDSRSFIGFKHINGAARWESYVKAQFAADWYREGDTSLSDIAKRIGDKHDTVRRMVNAIYVLEQAQDAGVFSIEDRMAPRFGFSHLYTALSRAPYMEFLGLDPTWSRYDPVPEPVPKGNLAQLAEVLRWLYGSKRDDVEPVIQFQNLDIRRLAAVLQSEAGLFILRTTHSLTSAHESTLSVAHQFTGALLRARDDIREASNNLRGFDEKDNNLVEVAADVSETAQTVHQRLVRKVRDAALTDASAIS